MKDPHGRYWRMFLAMVAWFLLVLLACELTKAAGPCVGDRCVSTSSSRGIAAEISVGGWRSVSSVAARPASPVVPILFGSDPIPAAGVYVGVIGGRGVTLTCWHAARHGVLTVASERPVEIIRDQYGYDMAAVLTRPLSVPAAQLGSPPRPGASGTIVGFPLGRYGSHAGRVLGYANPTDGQRYGDLMLGVGSRSGDSGGGVFCGGYLVGLLWGTRSDGTAGSMAIAVPAIADFLRRVRMKIERPPVPVPETWDGLEPCPPCESSGCAGPGCGVGHTAPGSATVQAASPARTEGAPPATSELAEIRSELSELRKLIAQIERGPQGEPGPRGDQGPQGEPGESAAIDYQAVAAQVAPLLGAMYFQPVDRAGNPVGQPVAKRLGDTVNLHSYLVERPK